MMGLNGSDRGVMPRGQSVLCLLGRALVSKPLNSSYHLLMAAGNFHRGEAAEFLKGFADMLRPSDSMIIGLDACNDPAKV